MLTRFLFSSIVTFYCLSALAFEEKPLVYQAGHPSLQKFLLPETIPSPADNLLTPERIELGKKLFFDPRLSGTGQSTCAWCHTPERGWSDGMKTGMRLGGTKMRLATPTITNLAYNKTFMWDGRAPTLDKQGYGGQKQASDINAKSKVTPEVVIARLNNIQGYVNDFNKAYPKEGLTRTSVGKALASFERSIVSNNSAFDQWVKGDKSALTINAINGFKLFNDPDKGNCVICHNPPNFTDHGFHNIGLAEYATENHLKGRGKHVPLPQLDGAFKTPTLRDIASTAPYMHDGSLDELEDVIEFYASGGEAKNNLSPAMSKKLNLSDQEKKDLVEFLKSLSSPKTVFVYPVLPKN